MYTFWEFILEWDANRHLDISGFLLLIFFLVATRFDEQEKLVSIRLAEILQAQPLASGPAEVIVNVTRDGEFIVYDRTLDEAGLLSNGHSPRRASVMAEWVPSEYSRLRLQYNRDDSYRLSDNQVYLQYTFSIGAHGAHAF